MGANEPAGRDGGAIVITGTDTGVGKTVLAALLARYLKHHCPPGKSWKVVKPICSGGREDAEILKAQQPRVTTLEEINPWHFTTPAAPVLAARIDGRPLWKRDVLPWLQKQRMENELLVVEGAGGLLSPLGEDFNLRDLINELDARTLLVAPNKLGILNQILLTLEALGPRASITKVVLMEMRTAAQTGSVDIASRTNRALLNELGPNLQIEEVPFLENPTATAFQEDELSRTMAKLLKL